MDVSRKKSDDILIVDGTQADLDTLTMLLVSKGYTPYRAVNGEAALTVARQTLPNLILLAGPLPDIDGYEVCRQLKRDDRTSAIPIIFILGTDSTQASMQEKLSAYEAGGIDYVTKPLYADEVLVRVETHLMLRRQAMRITQLESKNGTSTDDLSHLRDEFLTVAAHDLKSPLALVVGYADLLEVSEILASDADAQVYVQGIKRGTATMLKLIGDLLDLARIERGGHFKTTLVPISQFLRERLSNIERQARDRHIKLIFLPPEMDFAVQIDEARIAQVIDNLLSNAIKYSLDSGRVELGAVEENDQVLIRVVDSGIGIPAASIPSLFEKFYRVEDEAHLAVEGTGLGLSIVKAIVEQHRGKVWVISEPGQGSKFFVALPLGQPKSST